MHRSQSRSPDVFTSQRRQETRTSLPPQDVSELLLVSGYAVRHCSNMEDLPASRVGQGWRIRRAATVKWYSESWPRQCPTLISHKWQKAV